MFCLLWKFPKLSIAFFLWLWYNVRWVKKIFLKEMYIPMAIDRAMQFLLVAVLTVGLMAVSVPLDYEGVSPQEAFVVAFDERVTEGLAPFEEALTDWALELFDVADLEELEAMLMEELAGEFDEEFIALLLDLENFSFVEQMQFMQDVILDAVAEELGIDPNNLPEVPAELILAVLAADADLGPIVNELVELFSEEVLLDILGGWIVQVIVAAILIEVPDFDFAELLQDFEVGVELDFSLFAEMDYFLGAGTVDGLLELDVNERFELMGQLFGDFTVEWVTDNFDLIMEMLDGLMMLANLDLDEFMAGVVELEIEIGQADLEERHGMSLEGIVASVTLNGLVEGANLNVFVMNTGSTAVELTFAAVNQGGFLPDVDVVVDEVTILPGDSFTVQIPAYRLGEYANVIAVVGANFAGFTAELGFRFTESLMQ